MTERCAPVVIVAWLGLVAAVGCDASRDLAGGPGAVEVEVDTVDGVVRVRSRGAPPRFELDTLAIVGRTGGVAAALPDEFGRISSVTTRAGELYVADQQASEVRVFGAGGDFRRAFGRAGEGPGEYGSIYSLAWLGKRLVVLDFGNGRISELTSDGEVLDQRWAPGRVSGSRASLRFYPLADTIVYQWSLRVADGSVDHVWVVHRPDGIADTVPALKRAAPTEPTTFCEASDGSIAWHKLPFAPDIHAHPARDGRTAVGWSDAYRIALVDAEGDTLQVIERDRDPVPVSDEAWELARVEYEEFRESWRGSDCTPEGIERPAFRPAFSNVLADPGGRLWVEVPADTGSEWDIFDANGRLVATAAGFTYDPDVAPSIRGDTLAWVHEDELGVQRAVWARLVREDD